MGIRLRPSSRVRRRWLLGFGMLLGAIGALSVSGSVAAQEDPPNATGPCTARAVLDDGTVIDPYRSAGIYEVPRSGAANYEGSIDAAVPTPRPIAGRVEILTPPGIPNINVTDRWVWSNDESTGTSDSGRVTWDLPAVLPAGMPVTVEGYHQDEGARCEGSIRIKLAGNPWSSPVTWASLAGTAIAALGLAVAGFASATSGGAVATAATPEAAAQAASAAAPGSAPPPPPGPPPPGPPPPPSSPGPPPSGPPPPPSSPGGAS